MKVRLLPLAGLLILTGPVCLAQEARPADDSRPASSTLSGQPYPRIDSQLRATFRLKAPEAKRVQLHLDKELTVKKVNRALPPTRQINRLHP